MQNTLTFLNKFFWLILALLGVMLLVWVLLFSPFLEQANANKVTQSSSSSSQSTAMMSSSSSSMSSGSKSTISSSASAVSSQSSSSSSSSSSSASAVSSSSSKAVETTLIPTTQRGKYVTTSINGNTGYGGVNFRQTPCGERVANYKAWNVKGTVNLAPASNDKCQLGKYTWYFVEFEDGTKGWVVENNLAFSLTK